MIDNDQYKVKEISGYLGNPLKRKRCTFLVVFEDGDVVWKHWDYDLYDTVAYENFCKSRSELRFLHLTTRMANKSIRLLNYNGSIHWRPLIRRHKMYGKYLVPILELTKRRIHTICHRNGERWIPTTRQE
jgi:hypothetical protein